ncbi:phosphotransferase [Hamadaea sp.]|uniref:phosphotransferase enzyme family protein n=1 Tax=Hamadaea sp. TaxID=2024425 RepID=UPI0025BF94A2|nr:phosphotransferase [Hamadaea sp.]
MTSAAWSVRSGSRRYVAKLVPPGMRTSFEAGLVLAERLCSAGVDAGRPVRAADGSLCVPVDAGVLALLEHVTGRPLDGADPVDQQWWGDRLGSIHRMLVDVSVPGLTPWHWVREDAPHLNLADWLRPAVADAMHALAKLQVTDRLTVGALHGDPFYEAFLLDRATGRIGVIDWGSACGGPFVYDVASAVMYAGGPARAGEFLAAYAAAGPVPAAELEAALPVLLRFRWAVQADWYAARIADGDVTGSDDDGNRKGLEDARRALVDRFF